ncbi:MAG: glycosyl hydrolase-related protein [Phycisphaerae bacterium]|nr:glycosyl hydrolase-related protein [Phycisphaerae bacterium]
MAKLVLVVPHYHMDPVWRRAFDRAVEIGGVVMRPYTEVEAAIIHKWLELAGEGYTFAEGQVAVWRTFLRRNRASRAAVMEHARSGNFNMVCCGETISDTNMPAAEGLVRNYLLAWPMYEEIAGADNSSLQIGWVADAFGNGPNTPQILRLCGCRAAAYLSYRQVPAGQAWLGIDGTSIPVLDHGPRENAGEYMKHVPCTRCKGHGCTQCGKSGMIWADVPLTAPLAEMIDRSVAKPEPWAIVMLSCEEQRPNQKYLDIIRQAAARYAGQCEIRMGNYTELLDLMDLDAQPLPTTPDDLNPGMPGCYVTYIRNKQRTKQIAYELLAVEASLATTSWRKGKPKAPPKKIDDAWRNVLFNQFHDAITGTHIDDANDELMDMLDAAQAVTRSYGVAPAVRPKHAFAKCRSAEGMMQMGPLEVQYDLHGIARLLVNGQDLFGASPRAVYADRPFRVGELVVEDDWGDAWGTRKSPHASVQYDYSSVALADANAAVDVAESAIRWIGQYRGNDPRIKKLKWTVTACLSADGRRLDFHTTVDWDTHSKRLRVLVPVRSSDPTATWEVPFGFIDRTYDESRLDYSDWKSNTMEFPALHWVRKRIDASRGVAILNKGLPCFRWSPGRWDFSLLRSPEMPFCSYPLGIEPYAIDGWRDTGRHEFEYSIWPYTDGVSEPDLTRAGYAYNLPAPLAVPLAVEGNAIATAWKPAQDGRGWVLRVQEIAGQDSPVTVDLGRDCQVTVCDLLERPLGEPVEISCYKTTLHKHEIHTIRIA